MNHPYHTQHPVHHHSQQHQAVPMNYHASHAQQSVPLHPPPTSMRTIPLPQVRLSPLYFGNERALPPIPFAGRSRPLNQNLQWGNWRRLPSSRLPYPQYHSAASSSNALLGDATLPGKAEIMLVVMMPGGEEREVIIRPRTTHTPNVSILDVIRVVEDEVWEAEQRRPPVAGDSHRYIGQSVCRGWDGIWMWRGLAAAKGENDVWMLYL